MPTIYHVEIQGLPKSVTELRTFSGLVAAVKYVNDRCYVTDPDRRSVPVKRLTWLIRSFEYDDLVILPHVQGG